MLNKTAVGNIHKLKRRLKKYDVLNMYRLFRDLLLAKVFFNKNIRKIKAPFFILGKKYIKIGKNFTAGLNLRIEVFDNDDFEIPILNRDGSEIEKPLFRIGRDVFVNDYVHIGCIYHIDIGDNVVIGSNVLIIDHNHGNYQGTSLKHDSPETCPSERTLSADEVIIGENVWIGDAVCVLPGTNIGKGCVVGAMSVLKGCYPENSIITGNPASIIKQYDYEGCKWKEI